MSNRYEREIEEILRNLEHVEPKSGQVSKLGERLRRKPPPSMRTRPARFSFSFKDRLLLIAILTALLGAGYLSLSGKQGGDLFSLIFAGISMICIILVACSQFLFTSRRSQSYHYGNVTITPIHRNPFHLFQTRWNLFKLKMRYRRRNERK